MVTIDRREHEGAWHHVMNQGTAKADIFLDDRDRNRFAALLQQLEPRFGLEVHAYAQLGNHYHLLLRSRDALLSEGMQWMGARYARWFNDRHERVGAFFRGRFVSKPIDDERYLAWLPIYIHLNPVNDGFVERPEDWRWSSYGGMIGARRREPWVATGVVGAHMTAEEYRRLTERFLRTRPVAPSGLSPDLLHAVWDRRAHERRARQIEQVVAHAFGVEACDLHDRSRSRNPARTTAIALVARCTGFDRDEIAARYRLRSSQAVANAVRRADRLVQTDERAAVAHAAVAGS